MCTESMAKYHIWGKSFVHLLVIFAVQLIVKQFLLYVIWQIFTWQLSHFIGGNLERTKQHYSMRPSAQNDTIHCPWEVFACFIKWRFCFDRRL